MGIQTSVRRMALFVKYSRNALKHKLNEVITIVFFLFIIIFMVLFMLLMLYVLQIIKLWAFIHQTKLNRWRADDDGVI